ncbi:MAG: mechanosensitive ion channel domain-containing protein [Bacteroidota bacterium]
MDQQILQLFDLPTLFGQASGAGESVYDILIAQLRALLDVIPALLKAGVILLIGYFLARLLAKGIKVGLQKLGTDKLAKRLNDVEFIQRSGVDIKPSSLLSKIVYYFLMIIVLMTAVEALGMRMITNMMADLIAYIPQALTAFILLLLGIYLADFVKKVVLATCKSLNISAGNLIANVVFYFIFLNIVLISLRQASLQTSFMESNISIIIAGVAGAFAIGYGLASRDIMGNLLSAFYNRGRIDIGDEVTIDGKRGRIIAINNNSLTLRSEEDSEVIVPFRKLTNQTLEIHSRNTRDDLLPPNL